MQNTNNSDIFLEKVIFLEKLILVPRGLLLFAITIIVVFSTKPCKSQNDSPLFFHSNGATVPGNTDSAKNLS